jgi:eukaryotic-like serine/threonine-protein kinase
MALTTGTILAGRYEITAPIATGGMGEVWRARDRVLDRVVAAKVLRSEFTGDPSFVARFRNEARHTAALSHPNIASVYDYGETTDERGAQLAFLVMELVEGKPLVTILHEEGSLPVDWTLHVLGQAADGLSAAHRAGVVHRDIKPGNLIVRPDGVVKLTDFGIARARDATPLTRTGMVVGTAQYLSPEQAQGFEVTAASDVYSLGVVGYECLTGGRPFDGTSQVAVALAHINRPPPPLPAEVPPAVRLLIERSLAKDPADRFPDGAAFSAAVRSVAAGTGLAAVPPSSGALAGLPAGGPPTGGTAHGADPATAQTEVVPETGEGRTQVLGAATAAGAAAAGNGTAPRTMPPLRRDDADDEDDDEDAGPVSPAPSGSGRRRWGWLVAGLVLLALLAGGTWFVLAGDGDGGGGSANPTTSSSTPATTSAAPAAVPVDTDALVGRDADEVQAELEAAGLRVEQQDATAAQVAAPGVALAAGAVAGTDPANTSVPAGGLVTLLVAAEAYDPSSGEEQPGDEGDGGEQPAPTTTTSAPAPTTTSSAPPQTSTSSSSVPSTTTSTSTNTQPGSPAPEPEDPPSPVEPPPDQGGAEAPAAEGGAQQARGAPGAAQ